MKQQTFLKEPTFFLINKNLLPIQLETGDIFCISRDDDEIALKKFAVCGRNDGDLGTREHVACSSGTVENEHCCKKRDPHRVYNTSRFRHQRFSLSFSPTGATVLSYTSR